MREPPLDFPAYKSTALRHPKQPLIHVGPERGGPALAHLRTGEISNDLTQDGPVGERITVTGTLLDSDGRPVPDSLIEKKQRYGVAAICIGVGQGLAVVLENVS